MNTRVSLADAVNAGRQTDHCESLNGDYPTQGQRVAIDGRLGRRTATAHFFREEIVGANAVREGALTREGRYHALDNARVSGRLLFFDA